MQGSNSGGSGHKGGLVSGGYQRCEHPGLEPIKIGKHSLWLGAARCIHDVSHVDAVVSLNGDQPSTPFGCCYVMVDAALTDYGGVPKNWEEFIRNVAEEIKQGKKILGFCTGGHGRTGVFAASLVAVLTPKIADPIAYVREAHCQKAVESNAQVRAVFALLGRKAPEKYIKAAPPTTIQPKQMTMNSQRPYGVGPQSSADFDDDAEFMQMFAASSGQAPLTDEDEFNAALNAVVKNGDTTLMDAYEKKLGKRSS